MVPFTCIDRDHFRQHLEWPTPGQMAAARTEPISLYFGPATRGLADRGVQEMPEGADAPADDRMDTMLTDFVQLVEGADAGPGPRIASAVLRPDLAANARDRARYPRPVRGRAVPAGPGRRDLARPARTQLRGIAGSTRAPAARAAHDIRAAGLSRSVAGAGDHAAAGRRTRPQAGGGLRDGPPDAIPCRRSLLELPRRKAGSRCATGFMFASPSCPYLRVEAILTALLQAGLAPARIAAGERRNRIASSP